MKILFHTRTANEFDWQKRILELVRLPVVGEYIRAEREEADCHEVRMVVHLAGTSGQCGPDAEVFCNRIGPVQAKKLGWKHTADPAKETNHSMLPPAPLALLSVADAAKVANVSTKTLRRLIDSKRLAATDFGVGAQGKHNWRIAPEALAAIFTSAEISPPTVTPRRGHSLASSSARRYLPDA